jgi:iron complex transport system substrate-binding protein
MKKIIGLLLSVVMLTGILAGCAGTPAENSGTSTPESSLSTTDVSEPDENTAEAAWPRTITDDAGNEIVLEKKPERIVAINYTYLDYLLVLGCQPVGVSSYENFLAKQTVLEPLLENTSIEDIGKWNSISLEKIVELEPDLIITGGSDFENLYQDLVKIAPTISVNYSQDTGWKPTFQLMAQSIGEEETAQAYIAEFDQGYQQAKEKLASLGDESIMFLVSDRKTGFNAFGEGKYADLGLNIITVEGYQLSLEGLAELNPYHIFLQNFDGIDDVISELENNRVWTSLKAVENGNVHLLEPWAWSNSPTAISYAVEAVSKALTE